MIVLMRRGFSDIRPQMHKTTVEIDLNQLREAEANLGTQGFKATINRALAEVNRRAALTRGAEYVREGRLHTPTMEELWEMRKSPWDSDEKR